MCFFKVHGPVDAASRPGLTNHVNGSPAVHEKARPLGAEIVPSEQLPRDFVVREPSRDLASTGRSTP